MKSAQTGKTYKSPPRKLAQFFEKSRDQWKNKYREAKRLVKRLQNRVRFLEKSKDRWKSRVKELKVELARMKAREQALEKELDTLKKRRPKHR
jgi:chromosome segregation ATPase